MKCFYFKDKIKYLTILLLIEFHNAKMHLNIYTVKYFSGNPIKKKNPKKKT